MAEISEHRVAVRDTVLNVAEAGSGPAVVLLHGFPHTWQVWLPVIDRLAQDHRVIAPDLRGLGASDRPAPAYDAGQVAADVVALLDARGLERADLVGLDLGVPPALLAAMTRPERVRRLVVMESLAGALPGAEDVFPAGPPWWFGFHRVPGFAERVLEGHAGEYVDFFLTEGTRGRGVDAVAREAAVAGYSAPGGLTAAFEHYRALLTSGAQIAEAAAGRLRVPTMAIGAAPVGEGLAAQLRPIADDLRAHLIADCGHIVPQDAPQELLALLVPFLAQ